MSTPVRAPGYDLFKLGVTLILLLILTSQLKPADGGHTPPDADTPRPPAPTVAAPAGASPTPTPAGSALDATPAAEECTPLSPSRLKVGEPAVTRVRVNLRTAPGFGDTLIQTMPRGTRVEVIHGPVCTRYFYGSYLWWEVELPDGTTGWAAEASIWRLYYYLVPVE